MADTDIKPETVTPGDSQTPVQTPATTPVVNADDTAEVERLRKEAEQARMRANQLEKEKAARDKADEEARQKKLEEDNQYKDLFEQEKAKREALESQQTAKEQEAAVEKLKQEALSEYSEAVKDLAEEVGLSLTDTDDASVEQFKGKLAKINERVSGETRVTPNNPGQPDSKVEYTTEQLRKGLQEDKSFHDLVTNKYPGIAAMTKPPKVS